MGEGFARYMDPIQAGPGHRAVLHGGRVLTSSWLLRFRASQPMPSNSPEDDESAAQAQNVSDRHAAVRAANRSETAEDYVEAIDDLLRDQGEARVKDLAALFGVSHVTVSRTVDRLQRDGLVLTEPYRSIELTDEGRTMAHHARERHGAVLAFLCTLGVPPDIAEEDAEGIEHHVGPETLAAFERFVQERGGPPDEGLVAPPAPSPDRFARVRAAHAAELTEDYVEAIADLIAETGRARVVDLARCFGVSHVTVSRAIGRLQRDGYVITAPYRPVELTDLGRDLAATSRARHGVVLGFLLTIGVQADAAEIDAEGVEHHVSETTLTLFEEHTNAR